MPHLRHRPPRWNEATPDEELVGWAQRGERDAFGLLYDRYLHRVYGYCLRLLGSREAAEDANSIVFGKALAALPAFRARSFRPWLFAIAHNVAVDAVRARRHDLPLDVAFDYFDPSPTPEEEAIGGLERDHLRSLLMRLTDDQRQVVALRLSGLTAGEIAAVLGKPRNAVDGLHHRALLRLRTLVATGAEATKGGGPR